MSTTLLLAAVTHPITAQHGAGAEANIYFTIAVIVALLIVSSPSIVALVSARSDALRIVLINVFAQIIPFFWLGLLIWVVSTNSTRAGTAPKLRNFGAYVAACLAGFLTSIPWWSASASVHDANPFVFGVSRAFLVFPFVFIAVVETMSYFRRRRSTQIALTAKAQLAERNQKILENVGKLDALPAIQSSGLIARDANELCFFEAIADAMTPQTQTVQQGTYFGVGIPLFKTGLTINPGSFNATSIPVTSFAFVGRGSAYVTSERIVFKGPMQTVEIDFRDVADLTAYEDGLRLDVLNRSPWIFRSGDITLAAYAYRAVSAHRMARA
jgi:hypothetical protein